MESSSSPNPYAVGNLPEQLNATEFVSNNGNQQQFNWLENRRLNREPAADRNLQSGIEATPMQTDYPEVQSSFNQPVVNQGLPVSLHLPTSSFSAFHPPNHPINLANRSVQMPNSNLHQFNNVQTYNNIGPTSNQYRYTVPAENQCTYTTPTTDQPSCSQTQAKPVQQVDDWRRSLSKENRIGYMSCLIEATFLDWSAESMVDDRVDHLLLYAKKIENEIYRKADSEDDYRQLLVDKMISSWIEMKKSRRKRRIAARQLHVISTASNSNLPPPLIRIPTISGVAEVSNNLQPAPLNRNHSLDILFNIPELDQALKVKTKRVTKEWQKRLSLDLRKNFILNVIKRLWKPLQRTQFNKESQYLIKYAINIENISYNLADSRSEYIHELADRIYRNEKEIDRDIRMQEEHDRLPLAAQQALLQSMIDELQTGILRPSTSPQRPTSHFQNFPMMRGPH